jgi:hypothetical protein
LAGGKWILSLKKATTISLKVNYSAFYVNEKKGANGKNF